MKPEEAERYAMYTKEQEKQEKRQQRRKLPGLFKAEAVYNAAPWAQAFAGDSRSCSPSGAKGEGPSLRSSNCQSTPEKKGLGPKNGWKYNENNFCGGLPGAIAPLGAFDPLGFSEGADLLEVNRLREAELTHGRVGMLASAGFLVQEKVRAPFERERAQQTLDARPHASSPVPASPLTSSFSNFFGQFHPLFNADGGPAIEQIPALPPALWFGMTLGIGICESLRIPTESAAQRDGMAELAVAASACDKLTRAYRCHRATRQLRRGVARERDALAAPACFDASRAASPT